MVASGRELRVCYSINPTEDGLRAEPCRDHAGRAFGQRVVARLRWTLPQKGGQVVETFDRDELLVRLERAHDECARYQKRLSELPTATQSQYAVTWLMIGEIDQGLSQIATWLREPDVDVGLKDLQAKLDRVEFAAAELDELPDGLRDRLKVARRDYRSSMTLVGVCSAFVVLLLAGLVRFGWRQIFQPISAMHQGARRVAQGDFSYRVKVDSGDEMGELAESFNLMSERFQETAANLDRQVQDRSRQLVRSERLASVGLLAAGVAHEINNPLQAISMAADIVEMRVRSLNAEPDEDVHEIIRRAAMIRTESSRCGDITRRLLDFSRADHGVRTGCDLVGLVDEVRAMIGLMGRFGDRRVIFEPTGPVTAEVSAAQIKQVILNLTANALQAVSDDGEVEIRLIEQVDYVVLTVRDNGCGMTEETLQHVFDPFYSERQGGQGTGLGLSIIHRIIEDHDGTITPFSDGPGKGSTFSVRLPRRSRHCSAA